MYAISCFYPGRQPAICRPKPTWESCLQRAKENVKYVQICKKLLITPTVALSAEEKKVKEEVDWNRNYEELKVLREASRKIFNKAYWRIFIKFFLINIFAAGDEFRATTRT